MQFDWTTFALEIINFLVLLWILKRLLYKPVLGMLDARQQRISNQVLQAEEMHQEAEKLKVQYEGRITDWQTEQENMRLNLAQELARERIKQLAELKQSLADESVKERAREKALLALQEEQLTTQAKDQAYAATTAMLKRLATQEMTASIARVFEQDLFNLPEKERQLLSDSIVKYTNDGHLEIASAHPLDAFTQKRITSALSKVIPQAQSFSFIEKPELIAGLRISIGAHLLQVNLEDELAFFKGHTPHA